MKDTSIDSEKQFQITRYAYIDALRGVAILAVIFGHCYPRVYGIPDWISAYGAQGGKGVQLFFIISALTLFFSLNTRQHFERRFLLNYFVRRFFRIAPLFYTGIIFYLCLDGFSPRYWAPQGLNWDHITATTFFINGWYPSAFNSVVPGGWSIAVEAMFYLALPICINRIKDVNHAIWFVFATLLLSLLIKEYTTLFLKYNSELPNYMIRTFTDLWFPSQLPVFSIGFILYFTIIPLKQKQDIDKAEQRKSLLYSSIAIYLLVSLPFVFSDLIPQHFLYGLAFFLLVYSLAVYPQKLWVNPATCYIGKISFSCYLFHFYCIRVVMKILYHSNPPYFSEAPPTLQLAIIYVIVLLLTISIAHFSYKYIETPGMLFGQFIIKKIERI